MCSALLQDLILYLNRIKVPFMKLNFKLISFALASGLAMVFFSCKHEPDFSKMTEVSYSKHVAPIIAANCTFSGCHGDTLAEEFKLTTYVSLMNAGIKAGSPKSSKLYLSLISLSDEEIMPRRPYNELTEKQIQLIYVWIGQGAKNN